MTPTIALLAHLLGATIIFSFVYLWYRTSPANGSGWALFAAIIIAVFMNSPANQAVGVVIYGILTVGFGASWYFTRSKEYSGWLLFVAILSAFCTVDFLLTQ